MKWSIFIFKFNKGNNILLFNTYNKATVLLEYNEYIKIEQYLIDNNLDVNKEYIEYLKKLGFLIDIKYDEKDNFLKELHNTVDRKKKFNIIILTTMDCNFKCSYCYERGISKNKYFTNEYIEKIIITLKHCIELDIIEIIELTLFGGEPTLNWGFTTNLLKEIQKLCNNNGILFLIDMITNGYLLDIDKINTLSKYNIDNIQITLDGKKEIHDNRRMLLNGDKTFDKIVNNIKNILMSDIPKITIRINYDKSNAYNIVEFIEYLEKEFYNYKNRIKLSFGIIDSNLKYDNKEELISYREDLEKYYLEFYNKVAKSGFKYSKYFETGSVCMAKRNNSIIISPDNNIYKCLSLVGTEVGKIDDFKMEVDNKKNYLNTNLYEECFNRECEFIPMCHTGCRFKSFINDNRLDTKNCEYEAILKINTRIIESMYKL